MSIQKFTDQVAIKLSLLCVLHCLAFPFVLVLLPSVAALQLNNEAFHLWMVLAVIPISVYALTMGCGQHKRYYLLTLGLIGLIFLISAVALGESLLGEVWEKILTIIGAVMIAYVHYKNYSLCQTKSRVRMYRTGCRTFKIRLTFFERVNEFGMIPVIT